jgi:hypothetical protein
MNTKKLVSVLLILFALGTVVLFAATTDGIRWNYSSSNGVTTLTNTTGNDLYVTVILWNGSIYGGGKGYLAAGETKEIRAEVRSVQANRIKVTAKW